MPRCLLPLSDLPRKLLLRLAVETSKEQVAHVRNGKSGFSIAAEVIRRAELFPEESCQFRIVRDWVFRAVANQVVFRGRQAHEADDRAGRIPVRTGGPPGAGYGQALKICVHAFPHFHRPVTKKLYVTGSAEAFTGR